MESRIKWMAYDINQSVSHVKRLMELIKDDRWLTYREIAVKLSISQESVGLFIYFIGCSIPKPEVCDHSLCYFSLICFIFAFCSSGQLYYIYR